MITKVCCAILLLLCFDAAFTKIVEDTDKAIRSVEENPNKISHLDLLISDILKEEWTSDETVCLNKITNILSNVKNGTLWANWIWDSMQYPMGTLYGSRYQLGNYDQCMNAPWIKTHKQYQTKYCLVDIQLSNKKSNGIITDPYSSVKKHVETISRVHVTFNKITWGLCVPVECSSRSIAKFASALYKQTHHAIMIPIINMDVEPCQVSGADVEYSDLHNYFLLFLSVIFITTMTCTVLNNYYPIKKEVFGNKIIKAFCLKENTEYLVKPFKDDISGIHGIRAITAGIVVGLHVFFINQWIGYINPLTYDKDFQRFYLDTLIHAELVVDTYLMLSGLLLMQNMMSMREFNPLKVILKRYFKYATTLGLIIILFIVSLLVYYGDGPLWPRFAVTEKNACSKNWWITLLMLGNYVDTANICYPILWTVPCDFHLSVVGTILFWIFKKNRRIGIASFTILLVVSLILPGVVTYQQKLPPVPVLNMETIGNFRNYMFTLPTYLQSHLRAGPYLIGLGTGYLMTIYKPGEHRNTLTKVWSVVGFLLAFAVSVQILLMARVFQDQSKPYSVWKASLYASLNRAIWAVAMASIIAVCEYGTVPIVGSFLKWPVFLPLSKLSYGTYLLHTLVYIRIAASTRTPLFYDLWGMFFIIFGVITVSLMFSFLLHLFFEAPISRITALVLSKRLKTYDTDGSNISTYDSQMRCWPLKNEYALFMKESMISFAFTRFSILINNKPKAGENASESYKWFPT